MLKERVDVTEMNIIIPLFINVISVICCLKILP